MDQRLSDAQCLKFELLADGLNITAAAAAALQASTQGRPLTPADYASTSGLILLLDGDVWVNAPIVAHNPNFVVESPHVLDHDPEGFSIRGPGLASRAQYWIPPQYHGGPASDGRPLNHLVVTHGDRVRLSPTIGCAMVCRFCNVPYDDVYHGLKPVELMVQAVKIALADDLQPARHVLISGGTPGPPHVAALAAAYEHLLESLPGIEIDIMMVPVPGLFDLERLDRLGVHELSVNLEIFNESIAQELMPHKHRQGRDFYLDFLEQGAETLGQGRVRSMLMVGLEPLEDTLAGVREIARRGCVPVLSPFRPDPATPLRSWRPPEGSFLKEVYLRARDAASEFGMGLGPSCAPCTHNTLTFADPVPLTATGGPALASGAA